VKVATFAPPNGHAIQSIRKMAVLMILQGSAEAALGLSFTTLAIFAAAGRIPLSLEGAPAEAMASLVLAGPGLLAVGGLKIAGGVRNHSYRGKRLGIVALASGAFSVLTCACGPTAIALLVYGLRLHAHPRVERAFQMGEQGFSSEWIQSFLGERA
jgi:hypothetical protein